VQPGRRAFTEYVRREESLEKVSIGLPPPLRNLLLLSSR
jgi:hypothetical protein